MWDAGRKCVELSSYISAKENISGWRKSSDWQKRLKSQYRKVQKTKKSGGINKEQRLKDHTSDYLELARVISAKVKVFTSQVVTSSLSSMIALTHLHYFHKMLDKHIDLVDRRLLKGEKIPHSEKVFSLFEPHTKWINKGKAGVIAELGQKHLIVTDHNHFIVHHQLMDDQQDVSIAVSLAEVLSDKFGDRIESLSLDKGFSSKNNIEALENQLPAVMLKQKGRLSKARSEVEQSDDFKKMYNEHQAIESNINALEHHGLDKCPDKGIINYRKYVSLAVLSYNMHRTGKLIREEMIAEQKAKEKRGRKLAA